MTLRAETAEVAGRRVLVLSGSVDLSTVPAVQNGLVRLVVEHPGEIVAVDLDAVDVLDDLAMGVIIGAAGRARRAGGDMVIVCSDQRLREQFTITGLDRAITVVATLADR